MAITLIPSSRQQTQHILLEGVSWTTYQALLKELGDRRASRLAYDQGVLEIVMPSDLHELINRILALMVTALTDELGMKIRGYGSTTLERDDLARGVEPDSCFYIQNVERILGQGRRLDIRTDPPPDLAIEVDITSSSKRRFGIYLTLKIPEVWRYTEQQGIIMYQLRNGEYRECEFSPTFPMISGAVVVQFLQQAETEDDNSVIRALRQWLRNS